MKFLLLTISLFSYLITFSQNETALFPLNVQTKQILPQDNFQQSNTIDSNMFDFFNERYLITVKEKGQQFSDELVYENFYFFTTSILLENKIFTGSANIYNNEELIKNILSKLNLEKFILNRQLIDPEATAESISYTTDTEFISFDATSDIIIQLGNYLEESLLLNELYLNVADLVVVKM